jgi:hypothetical protein
MALQRCQSWRLRGGHHWAHRPRGLMVEQAGGRLGERYAIALLPHAGNAWDAHSSCRNAVF